MVDRSNRELAKIAHICQCCDHYQEGKEGCGLFDVYNQLCRARFGRCSEAQIQGVEVKSGPSGVWVFGIIYQRGSPELEKAIAVAVEERERRKQGN